MQTFLPYEDFEKCAKCLDNKRLYKQIVECKQILNTLTGKSKGWINHPAVKMWKGYESTLRVYAVTMLEEWIKRRWKEPFNLLDYRFYIDYEKTGFNNILPHWLGDENLHLSHRANLYRKDPEHYKQFLIDFDEWNGHTNEEGKLVCEPYYWKATQ